MKKWRSLGDIYEQYFLGVRNREILRRRIMHKGDREYLNSFVNHNLHGDNYHPKQPE